MAKEKKSSAGDGDTVELADKETSFYDPATQLKIVRDGSVKLGKTIGNKTNVALMSGRLVVVGKSEKEEPQTVESDLPEDLPGRDTFIAAGMNFEQVKTFDFEKDKVTGVGAKTVEALTAYLKK